MITRITLTSLLTLALHSPALATKFQLGSKAEQDKTVGNATDRSIEGVLVKEENGLYTIRVVGGEITIAKSQVVSTSEDGLTIAKIEDAEKSQAEALAAADNRRREVQAAEASASRRAPEPAPQPAERSLLIEVDFQDLLPGYQFRAYDPVLRRANINGLRQVITDYLRREVKSAAHRR